MAPGKYAKVIDQLPRWNGNEPKYQDKVNAVKAQILAEDSTNRYASVLAQKYADVRLEKDVHEDLLSEVNLRLAAISELLVESYENEATTSLSLASGPTVRVQYEPHAQVIDHDKLRQWAIEDGLERDLQLPWQTVNRITKERLLEGLDEPEGVVAHSKSKIVLVKG